MNHADQPWRKHAACYGIDTEVFFPPGETGAALPQIAQAKAICTPCPVRIPCLEWALAAREWGIWGATTDEERRAERRRRSRRVS